MKLPSFQGPDSIVRVLLTHGEKIVIGLVTLCVAWFIYSSLTLESSPVQPEMLRTAVQNAQKNVEQLKSVENLPDEEKIELRDFDSGSVMNPISATAYEISVPLNPPEFPRKVPRSDPELLTIEQIEVSADVGVIAYATDQEGGARDAGARSAARARRPPAVDELLRGRPADRGDDKEIVVSPLPESLGRGGYRVGGQDRVEVRAWTCLMAKVPVDKQAKLYDRTFRDAEGWSPESDRPQYLGYFVQRADVTAGGEPKWENLKTIGIKTLEELRRRWGSGTELVDVAGPEYIHDALTYPLPRRVERGWDASVCPSDMLARRSLQEPEAGPREPRGGQDPGLDGFGPFDARTGRGERGAYSDDGRRRDALNRGELRAGGEAWSNTPLREAPQKLFRFFDLVVVPGRRYQYRVRLVLTDPNHDVEIRYLADEVIERREKLDDRRRPFVFTSWSDPSPVITIPSAGQLLVGPVRAARPGSAGEPTATVVANTFEAKKDVQAITRVETMPRGTLGNFKNDDAAIIDYAQQGGQMTQETVEFRTNNLLVDMRGGDELSKGGKGLTAPGRVLIVDQQGNLFVREQVADQDDFRRFTLALEALEEAAKPPDRGRGEADKAVRGDERGRDRGRDPGRDDRSRRNGSRSRGGR